MRGKTKVKLCSCVCVTFVSSCLFLLSFRPSSKQPPTLPKPCIIANVKYSSWALAKRDIVWQDTKILHYENSEDLKKRVVSLKADSEDLPCPFGALSRNGAMSLRSGTCKVFIFCIYCHAVHCARHLLLCGSNLDFLKFVLFINVTLFYHKSWCLMNWRYFV